MSTNTWKCKMAALSTWKILKISASQRWLTYTQNSNGYTYIFEYTEPNAFIVDIVRHRQMPGNSKWRLSTRKSLNYLYLSRGLTYMQNSNGFIYIFEYIEPNALTVDIVRRRPMPENPEWLLPTWKKPGSVCIPAQDWLAFKISTPIPTFFNISNPIHIQLTLFDAIHILKI